MMRSQKKSHHFRMNFEKKNEHVSLQRFSEKIKFFLQKFKFFLLDFSKRSKDSS